MLQVASSPVQSVVGASLVSCYGNTSYEAMKMSEEVWAELELTTNLRYSRRTKKDVQQWWGRRSADDLYTAHVLAEYYWRECERRRGVPRDQRSLWQSMTQCLQLFSCEK